MIHTVIYKDTHQCVEYAFSERQDGDMRDDQMINRLLHTMSLPSNSFVRCKQTHGNVVAVVTEKNKGNKIPIVDGLIFKPSSSFNSSISLSIITADCIPVLFYDDSYGIIGAAHAGWKGIYLNITHSMITHFSSNNIDPKHIHAIIGPNIGPCCYSVSEERAALFKQQFGLHSVERRNGSVYLNLSSVLVTQLIQKGIPEQQITVYSDCTSCKNDRFFSFRQDSRETYGEQLGVLSFSRYN